MTRLYFHSATDATAGLPTSEQSTLTSNKDADVQTVNRSMTPAIGSVQATLVLTSNVTTSTQNYYFSRFVSPPLFQLSIAANTWTYNFAANQGNIRANFPVNGTNQPVRVNCYVWRPSTSTKIGTILDGNTQSTIDEPSPNSEVAHHVSFTGAAVSSMTDDDVLIFEVWFVIIQQQSAAFTDVFYYDGSVVNTTDNSTVSDHASFIETPEDLSFAPSGSPEIEPIKRRYFSIYEIGLNSDIINLG